MHRGALEVVETWHDAVNEGSARRVRASSAENVQVLGPRGSGTIASQELGDWMIRSGFSATPERWFCGGDGKVVVEQSALWTDRATGAELDRRTVATHFRVEHQLVVTARRHAKLIDALEDAGLSLADEVTRRS
jgi:hypothetical protein